MVGNKDMAHCSCPLFPKAPTAKVAWSSEVTPTPWSSTAPAGESTDLFQLCLPPKPAELSDSAAFEGWGPLQRTMSSWGCTVLLAKAWVRLSRMCSALRFFKGLRNKSARCLHVPYSEGWRWQCTDITPLFQLWPWHTKIGNRCQ